MVKSNSLRLALCTVGSTGDIQPFLALGKRLIAAGHRVTAFSHPFHADRFAKHGIDFVPCGPEVELADLNALLNRMLSEVNPVKQLRLLLENAFFEDYQEYFASVKSGIKGFDLVIAHMVDFLSHEAAAQLNIPRISVILAPAGIRTDYSGPLLLPDGPVWVNRLGWKMMELAMFGIDQSIRGYLNELGGPTIEIHKYHALSPGLNLIAASPTLAPTYPDLPDHFSVTGPWILPEPEFVPPQSILDFLEKYPKPVIVSFGSMGGEDGPAITETVITVLERLKTPAIIQSGYAQLFREDAPENILFVDYVPHGWLFEKGVCVVHHGGAGTTTAVCRAGVPSVVVTFIADQPYFAAQLNRLGIAPKSLWYRRLSVRRLESRLKEILTSKKMQQRAADLRAEFLQEEGTRRAIFLIEAHAAQLGILGGDHELPEIEKSTASITNKAIQPQPASTKESSVTMSNH